MTGFFDERKWRDQTEARAAADALIEIVERHEDDDHGGGVCPIERAGMVAFVAHCLGVTTRALDVVRVCLASYENDDMEVRFDD